ncbi:MAG: hypothetical protein EOM11_08100 [Erysipelotrichia bacterium]|nr:hypothetical protein [Erysipelotrichia bacterium]
MDQQVNNMITPEEARNTMMKIESNDAYYGELQEELKLMATYITQQEKKDNLLELYREHHELVPFTPGLEEKSKRVIDISIEINKLEKELEELK